MNESEVREIVRDEIDQWWKDQQAARASADQKWLAEHGRRLRMMLEEGAA